MFLLVCLISGPAGAGSGEDSPSYVLQIHKVTSREDGTILLLIFGFSVTSRRGLPTSRRQFHIPLSRRDVNFHFLCHVATWTSHVATSVFTSLCHVATSPRTSRRGPVLSPRAVHLWLFTSHTPLIGTLASYAPAFTGPAGAPIPPVGGPSIAFRPPLCLTESPSTTGSESLW